ncbi:diacylglycerol kinase family protein [Aquisalimonas sp.]|uniref:diacylglycerol/lipid kinase family protein n=1 Tax=Aquisalimonas sp. TaxID=1872621 RepID=UPI0025BA23D0|nr:YegS/Rv2252/BmrU family lipid kinase [Aquisalimonas sp.]
MRRLSFIVNPAAGGGREARRGYPLLRKIRAQAPGAEVLITRQPGDARRWAEERRSDRGRIVVAVGGDGTVSEIGSALAGGEAALGVLPSGSGNDFARMLETPQEVAKAVAFFNTATAGLCDVGEVVVLHADGERSRHRFLVGLGVGYPGVVAATASHAGLLKGFSSYLVAALRGLFTYHSQHMTVTSDSGCISQRLFLVVVGKGRWCGGGFQLLPQARMDDGWLHVCLADAMPVRRILRILLSAVKGSHGRHPEVALERTTHLSITCAEGAMVHSDGEWVASHAVRIEVRLLPRSLAVLGAPCAGGVGVSPRHD